MSRGIGIVPLGTFSASRAPSAPVVGSDCQIDLSMTSTVATETNTSGSARQRLAISRTAIRAVGRM